MTRVKICGITRVEDARAALDAGADAIGLVFAESPRRVTLAQAEKIRGAVGPWMATVGVFVNASAASVRATARRIGLTAVQLHGDESVRYARSLGNLPVIKAIRVENQASIGDTKWPVDAVLFDTAVRGLRGGTGRTFDWSWLAAYRGAAPFIVSGGLNPANVVRALEAARPYGVDVSGGVEKEPGIKDAQKIREFVRRAKRA